MRRVVVPGLLGGIVLIVWTFVVSGLLGFRSNIDMNRVPNERVVFEVLKEHVVEPGRYVCNPEVKSAGFPAGEPVYSILYSGMGHEAAGRQLLVGFVIFLVAPILGTWMLSQGSERFLSSYPRKVLFFTVIGLLFAVFGDLANYGIGGYPLRSALLLAVHSVAQWTVIGLVVAWRIRPLSADARHA